MDLNQIIQQLASVNPERSEQKPSVYFIGIGGIGMSALARYFNSIGVKVSGYDKTETVLTRKLVEEGMSIHYKDDLELLDKAAALVVYTPAVPKQHAEYNYYLDNQYPLVKRSDVLGAIANQGFSICVGGTHGKTTTSTMLAHLLRHSDFGCTAFLGGISANYDTNFWNTNNAVFVAEADEFDRSFLKLNPDIAIISSMDSDHLDIYGTAENLEEAFIAFSKKIKPGGCLISKYGLKRSDELFDENHIRYHFNNPEADAFADNIRIENGSYRFNVVSKKGWVLNDVLLNMGGMHNVENAVAALTAARQLKIPDDKLIAAMAAFTGVKRRFEYVIPPVADGRSVVMIDDYAHHPAELDALISGVKKLFPKKKCTIIFQPHLFSRTNDHASGFAEVLDTADAAMLLPIYPAREIPMIGVNSEMILDRMKNKTAQVISKEQLMEWIRQSDFEVLVTAGAGDIDTLVPAIKKILMNKTELTNECG